METDLPELQPLLPLRYSHALVGLTFGLAPLGTTPLLIFGGAFCPPLSSRACQLRGSPSAFAEGLCMLRDSITINELSLYFLNFCATPLHLSIGQPKTPCFPQTVPSVYTYLQHRGR